MFFQGWDVIFKTIILSILMYISIIIIIRVSGKRTLADFNAFDFLVSVTIGSISASTILFNSVKLFDGIASIITLSALQYIVAKISVNSKNFRKLIKAEPTLLYYDGEYLHKNMKKMRVAKDDILQEVRLAHGIIIADVHSVIIEATGKLSIITKDKDEDFEDLLEYK